MIGLVSRRLLGAIVSLLSTLTLVFLMIQLVPGDPAQSAMVQALASSESLESRQAMLGLDDPLGIQYIRYMRNILSGDLGTSWHSGQPVSLMISKQLKPTATLILASMMIAILFGSLLGISSSIPLPAYINQLSRVILSLFVSTPVLLSSFLGIGLFSVGLGLLPATGQGTLRHVLLPALVVGCSSAGSIGRQIESDLAQTLGLDFVVTARSKGIKGTGLLYRHVLRVGLLPVLDIIALQMGYFVGGTVVVEAVFARSGLGRLLLTATLNKDLPVLQGCIVLLVLIYSALTVITDISYGILDPRLRNHESYSG